MKPYTHIRIAVGEIVRTWGLTFLVVTGPGWIFYDNIAAFHHEIRGFLFSGYLTLGSFLLTTKTFVITRLQEGLFQSKIYEERYQRAKAQHPQGTVGEKNGPLRRLTEFLVWSVATCLSTAVLQLLLSIPKNSAASAVALGLAAGALALVLRSWLIIRGFMHQYLVIADEAPPR